MRKEVSLLELAKLAHTANKPKLVKLYIEEHKRRVRRNKINLDVIPW